VKAKGWRSAATATRGAKLPETKSRLGVQRPRSSEAGQAQFRARRRVCSACLGDGAGLGRREQPGSTPPARHGPRGTEYRADYQAYRAGAPSLTPRISTGSPLPRSIGSCERRRRPDQARVGNPRRTGSQPPVRDRLMMAAIQAGGRRPLATRRVQGRADPAACPTPGRAAGQNRDLLAAARALAVQDGPVREDATYRRCHAATCSWGHPDPESCAIPNLVSRTTTSSGTRRRWCKRV